MIGFNPCGRAVEWLKYPYTRKARLFADPSAPLVDLIWYPTDQPFLPFPTTINAKIYDDDAPNHHGLGEVWFPTVPKHNFHKGIPGLQGDHICGTPAQFIYGQVGVASPPTQYDGDRIPLCCGRNDAAFVAGGAYPAAEVEIIPGGVGLVTGGAYPAAEVTQLYATTAEVSGGAYPAAEVTQLYATTAEVSGGAYPAAEVEILPGGVGLVTGGAYPAAEVEVIPGCPLLAVSCAAAPLRAVNRSCIHTWPEDNTRWLAWDVPVGETVYIEILPDVVGIDSGSFWDLYEGDDCGTLDPLDSGTYFSLPITRFLLTTKSRIYFVMYTPPHVVNHVTTSQIYFPAP